MAKTIYEMAFEHYPHDSDNSERDCYRTLERVAFILGADAVLKEIENSLAEFSNTEDYSIIQRKIKELKGE